MPPPNETKRKRKPPTHTDSETDDAPSDSIPDTIKDAVISWFNKHLTTEMDIPDALSEGVRKGDRLQRIWGCTITKTVFLSFVCPANAWIWCLTPQMTDLQSFSAIRAATAHGKART